MNYIDRNLLPGERILFRTKKHPIIFFFPIVLSIFVIYATNYMHDDPILYKLEWAPWLIAAIIWGYISIEYITSEFVVTDKRIMMREGYFNRHSSIMRISTISQVSINQSLFGVWLDYGTIVINAMGAYDAYPTIAKPFQFQRTVNDKLNES